MVEGTTQGSVTDIDGYFKQSVASNATLSVSYTHLCSEYGEYQQYDAGVEVVAFHAAPHFENQFGAVAEVAYHGLFFYSGQRLFIMKDVSRYKQNLSIKSAHSSVG